MQCSEVALLLLPYSNAVIQKAVDNTLFGLKTTHCVAYTNIVIKY